MDNRRDRFTAFVVVSSLFLIPILCVVIGSVSASAEEISSPTPFLADTLDASDSHSPLDYGYNVYDVTLSPFATWEVYTPVGTYQTASRSGVYTYLTSFNDPKASTRSTTSAGGTITPLNLTTKVFVFRNVNKPLDEQKNMTLSANFYDTLDASDSHSPHYYTTFTFSNPTTIALTLRYLPLVENPSYTDTQFLRITEYTIPSDDLTVTCSELIEYAHQRAISSNPSPGQYGYVNYDECILSGVTLSIDVTDGFDNAYPTTSYVDVTVDATRTEAYNNYIKTIGSRVLDIQSIEQSNFELGYEIGSDEGYRLGFDLGYDNGYSKGQTEAELNFSSSWFIRGVDAFLGVTLFEYPVGDNNVPFTLGSIFTIVLGGTALLWFLKIFAGG